MSGNRQNTLIPRPGASCNVCTLIQNDNITDEVFCLAFAWPGAAPDAGQFFMLKPKRSAVFLGRPVSVALWEPESRVIKFLIALRGRGTGELASMRIGEEAELTGPFGNAWTDFLPDTQMSGGKPVALVGGGIGIAPLEALCIERPECHYILYAGFRTGFKNTGDKDPLPMAAWLKGPEIIIATEDGSAGLKGRITDFLEPQRFSAVCACGPEPMLKAVAAKCTGVHVPCFISMERRMACGAGACLGCTIRTVGGNRRCCADGPIFCAGEVIFDV